MRGRFDYFVVFAGMRTGSNFLQENLNAIPGLRCWGEAFNPHFVGKAGADEMAGITRAAREADPRMLLAAIQDRTEGLAGFRFFHDHDPRMLEHCLDDPRCAKIVLTRNPLDSYVSLKIARQTGQWRLGDMRQAKRATIRFEAEEFAAHLDQLAQFRQRLMRRLQVSGQTAFHLGYDDLGDVEVMNGIAAFLGIDGRLDRITRKTKVQNPAPLSHKVENYDEMEQSLGGIDPFALSRTPDFEPRRGPHVPDYVAATAVPLLYLPVKGGPQREVEAWLAALGGDGALQRDRTQKQLRQWKRRNPQHRSFTVLRHPVARLHDVFCRHILMPGPEAFGELRATLRAHYALPIPETAPDARFTASGQRAAFLAFIGFVKGNLGNQTSLRVDAAWASQSAILQGMAQVALPDAILREEEMAEALPRLARSLGVEPPALPRPTEPGPHPLAAIYDAEIEAAVRDIYQKDYMMFGFRALA